MTVLWCLGDSITEGKVDPNPSYRPHLSERTNPASRTERVVMTGTFRDRFGLLHNAVSGYRADNVLAQMPGWWAALPVLPTDVTLLIGTNNIAAGTGATTTRDQVQAIIDWLGDRDVRTWVSLILPRLDAHAASVATYNAQIETVTDAAGMIEPGAAAWWSNATCIGPDLLHTTPHFDVWFAREWLAEMRNGGLDI